LESVVMKVFVISLARAPERRRKMQDKLSALNVPFEIFEATDCCHLTLAERAFVDDAARRKISKFPLVDSEIACWHSHRRIMVEIAENGPEMVTVLEDDAGLSQHFPKVLEAIEQSGLQFDLIDLHRIFRKIEIFYPCCNLCESFDLGRIRYSQMRLTGYVISRRGAQKFLRAVPRFAHMVDKSMKRWWDNGLSYFVLSEPVVMHDDCGCSLIDETRAVRVPYVEADSVYWRAVRLLVKFSDSVQMRVGFPVYLREGRRAARGASSARPADVGKE
jgi:glycosyl transferase, family 25